MALKENVEINRYLDQQLRSFNVNPDTTIYKGALVGLDSITMQARPIRPGDTFVGIAYEQAQWPESVMVLTQGDFEFEYSGALYSDIGRPVFALDDNTLTLDSRLAGVYIGRIIDVPRPAIDRIVVRIEPMSWPYRTITVPLITAGQKQTSLSRDIVFPVAIFARSAVITAIHIWFEKRPSEGYIDVGVDTIDDPDDIVDFWHLRNLPNGQAVRLPISKYIVYAGRRIVAKISRIGRTKGFGGGLSVEYIHF